MDSFYPNFGEVELILVEDNNDFVDPLEANYECEDENEDIKLQLNDNVYEEGDFQMHVDDNSRSSNDEYFHQKQAKSETNGAGRSIKAENHCDSDDSYGVGFIDSSSQNIDSSDSEEFIETKPDVQTLLNNAATKSADSFNQLISTDEDKKQSAIEKTPVAVLSKSTPASSKLSKSELPVEPNYAETKSAESKPAETKPVVTKSALTRSVVKETAGCSAKPSTSKAATNDCEKESKPRKKRRKQIKEEKVQISIGLTRHCPVIWLENHLDNLDSPITAVYSFLGRNRWFNRKVHEIVQQTECNSQASDPQWSIRQEAAVLQDLQH